MSTVAPVESRKFSKPNVLSKLMRDIFRRDRSPGTTVPLAKPARRQSYALEPMEPRLLLSADLSYAALSSAHDFTVKAVQNAGNYYLNLYDSGNLSGAISSKQITGGGDVAVSVARDDTLGAQGLNGDTVHIDLDSLALLNTPMSGHALAINFQGGSQRIFTDHVTVDGLTGAVGYSLSVQSSSDILSSCTANVTGDFTLTSTQTASDLLGTGLWADCNTAITLTGANLKASGALSLVADSNISVSTDGTGMSSIQGAAITSFSAAKIDIGGASALTANSINVDSKVEGTLSASAAAATFKIVAVEGNAQPEVTIHGASSLTAATNINIAAESNVTINASTAPGSGSSDSSVDAAVVNTTYGSGATLAVSDSSLINASGTANLTAGSKLNATTTADANVANTAGAAVAVSVITGDTTASVSDATVDGSAVSVASTSGRIVTTLAKSSPGGSSASSGGSNASEQTLANNNASTSDGSIKVAGAVAVNTDTGSTKSFLQNATIGAGAGAATVSSASTDVVSVTADGEFTGDTKSTTNGVGVGVAINVADRTDLSYIAGVTDITAGSLFIQVLAPAQSSFSVMATSGVGAASNVGFAGSLAINVAVTDHEAYIDQSASVTLHGNTDVSIEADTNILNVVKALPADGGGNGTKVGIGASVAFNDGEDITAAAVRDNADLGGVHNLSLTTNSTHQMKTDATSGGKGSTAVTPVVAISVASDDSHAMLGSGGLLSISGDFNALSSLRNNVATTATGDTHSSSTGVGISVGVTVVNDTSLATTGRDLLTSGGAAAFVSSAISGSQSTAKASVAGGEQDDGSSQNVNKKTGDQKSFADSTAKSKDAKAKGTDGADAPSASTSDGPVSVAGAVAVNIELASSRASVGDGRHITSTGALKVLSSANVDGTAAAEGSAVIGQVKFAPSAVSTTDNTIDLGSSSGLKTGDQVTYFHGNGGSDIGGLTDDTDYYVRDTGSGKFKLYNSANDANNDTNSITLSSQGTGTEQTMRGGGAGGTGVGAAVSVNYAKATNLATVGSAVISAGGLDVEATQADRSLGFDPANKVSTTNNTIDVGQSGLRTGDAVVYHNGGGTSVGGLSDASTYYVNVQDDGTLRLYDTQDKAIAGGSDGLKVLSSTGSGTSQALVERTDSLGAWATSGAGGGKTGVAGSVAINVIFTDTEADAGYVTNNVLGAPAVTITANGDVTLKADSEVSNIAKAQPTDGGGDGTKVGVGISVAVNYAQNTTSALIADGSSITGANNLSVDANSAQDMSTESKNGAKGSTAVTPVVAVSITANDTSATIGSGSLLTIGGNLEAKAALNDQVSTSAEGDTQSDDTGVGISIAVGVVNDNALATTGRGLAATGTVTLSASAISGSEVVAKASVKGGQADDSSGSHADGGSNQSVDNSTNKQTGFADGKAKEKDSGAKGAEGASNDKGSTSDGGVSVAGAVSVAIENASAKAYVPDGGSISAGGMLSVTSAANVDGHAIADGSASTSSGGTGVGVAVSVNVANLVNQAYIGNGAVISAGGLTVQATVADRDITMPTSTVQVVDTAKDTIFLGRNSGLKTGDHVMYDANSNTAIGGLSSLSSSGYYVNVNDNGTIKLYDTKEHAASGGSAGLVDLTSGATGTDQRFYKFVSVSSVDVPDLLNPIKFNPTGTVLLLNLGTDSSLRTGDSVKYDAKGGAVVGGLADGASYYVIELADGQFQLAASRQDAQDGKAIVLSGSGNSSQQLVDQSDSFVTKATSGAGGGKIGVAGSVTVNVVNSDTEALVGRAPGGVGPSATSVVITAAGNVSVAAASNQTNISVAAPSDGGGSGTSVGVGASVAVNVLTNTVNAEVSDGVAWSGSAGAFSVDSNSADAALTHGQNGASSSSVAVGVGVSVVVVQDTTSAYLGSGSGITAGGNVGVTSEHTGDFKTLADAEANSSSVAVGASVAVAVVIEDVSADLARDIATTGGALQVSSNATVSSDVEAVAATGGEKKDSTEQNSSNDSSKKGADGQADHQINDNANTNKGSKTATPSAQGETSSANGKSSSQSGQGGDGVGVAAAVAVNVASAHNSANITHGAHVSASGAVTVQGQVEIDATAKGVGTSVQLDSGSNVNVAAGVGLNVVNASNVAYVDSGSDVRGNGITIQAISPAGKSDNFIAWGAAAGGGQGDVGVAGSVAINVITLDSEAYSAIGSSLESSGALSITSTTTLAPQTVAAGVGFSQGTAVGAAISVAVVNVTSNAYVDGYADVAGALAIDSEVHLETSQIDIPMVPNALKPSATSIAVAGGASSGDVGVGAAVIVDDFTLNTSAYIGDGANINQAGPVGGSGQTISIHAENDTAVTSIAGGLGVTSGSAGVGASLDLEILNKQTFAYVGNALVRAGGSVNLSSNSTETMLSVVATAGGADTAGIAGSVSVAVITDDTHAYLADYGVLHASGALGIAASDTFKTTMIAGAIGAAGTAGIGAANATLVHKDTTLAYIGNDADVTAGDTGASVTANASEDILSIVAGIAAGGTVGVAGSAAVNDLNETTSAYVGQSATVSVTSGDLNVIATDTTKIISVAGSLGAGGTVGAGVGADIGVINKATTAYIDSGVTADVAGNIVVDAESNEDLISISAGLGAGSVGVAVNAGVHVFTLKTQAFIGDDPADATPSAGPGNVHAHGSVVIAANDITNINEIVGVLAAGSVGAAAAAGVNVMTVDTSAFIGSGANVTGDGNGAGVNVNTGSIGVGYDAGAQTFSSDNPSGQGIETSSGNTLTNAASGNRSSFQAQGHVKNPQVNPMDLQNTGSKQNVQDPSLSGERGTSLAQQAGFHGVAVTATNRDEIRTFTMSLAGGEVAVSVSAGVDVVNANTNAYIGDSAIVNDSTVGAAAAQSVLVGAGDDFYHLALAATLAGGVVAVAPAVGVNVIANTTSASIGNSASVNALNDVVVQATAKENVVMVGIGVSGGFVGVGGVVDVLSISNKTLANIGDSAKVYAGGDVNVFADDQTHVLELSGALSGGFVGVGASVGVLIVGKDTEAMIGANAKVDASGNGAGLSGILDGSIIGGNQFGNTVAHGVVVQAQSSEDILHIVATGSGGFVGVAGAVGVSLITSATHAAIGTDAAINQLHQGSANSDQSVYVNASNDVNVQTFIVGIAGGFVGVAGAVDVGSLNNNITAEIQGGSSAVAALQDVNVNAVGLKSLQGFDVSGSGGFVGVGGAVNVWSVGTPIQTNYQDNNGQSSNSIDSGNGQGSADSSAGQSAQNGTGLVTGNDHGLRGTFKSSGSNSNTSGNRVAAASQSAGSSVSNRAPNQASIAASEAATPAAPPGTSALIRSGAHVTAGQGIGVQANEKATFNETLGQFSGGFVGAGASVGILSIADNVTASAGGELSAGGNISIVAALDENLTVLAIDGAAGFVGIGAAVVVVNDSSTISASLADGAQVHNAASLNVSATAERTYQINTDQVGIGVVTLGASFTRLDVTGDTAARIGNNVQIGQGAGDVVGDISVTGTETIDAHAHTLAIAAGAVAISANFAFVDVGANASASIGDNAAITSAGTVDVQADGELNVNAEVLTASGGLGAVGASIAHADLSSSVIAGIGAFTSVAAGGNINVQTRLNNNGNGPSGRKVRASAVAPSIAVGQSGSGTDATATDSASANAYVGGGAALSAGGSIGVDASSSRDVEAQALGLSLGLGESLGIGYANATDNGSTTAEMDGSISNAARLEVTALAVDTAQATADAASAGLGAGGTGGDAIANVTPNIVAGMGYGSVNVSGAISVSAISTTDSTATANGFAAGLVAGIGVMLANADTSPTLDAHISGGVVTAGAGISLLASNNQYTQNGAHAIASASGGGIVSGQGAVPTATGDATLNTYVGSGADLNGGSAGVSLSSNSVSTVDATAHALSIGVLAVGASLPRAESNGLVNAHMDGTVSGGASLSVTSTASNTATALAEASGGGLIDATLPLAWANASPTVQAYLGNGANVTVSGAANLSATTYVNASATAEGISIGLGAVGVMRSSANVSPTINVFIGSGSNVSAGSISLTATHNSSGAIATSDASGGGIVSGQGAVPSATADAIVRAYVGSGATLQSSGAISLAADATNTAVATAHALSIGLLAIGASLPTAEANGLVSAHMDGIVTGGSDLYVSSTSNNTATAVAEASGGGLIAATLPLAWANASPTLQAYLGNGAIVTVSGAVNLSATSYATANATAEGLSVGFGALGVMRSSATVSPAIQVFVGSGANVSAGSISLTANHFSSGAIASSDAAGGGIYSGQGAVPSATADASVQTYVGSGAKLQSSGAISLVAQATNTAIATAKTLSFGLVGLGASLPTADANGYVSAHMDGNITGGSDLTVEATANNVASAQGDAAAGGLFGGVGDFANATASPTVNAYIGSGARLALSGAVRITARATDDANAYAPGLAVGLVGIGATTANATVAPHIDSYIGGFASVSADSITIKGLHNTDPYGNSDSTRGARANSTASSGGLVGVDSATSTAIANADTRSHIDFGSSIAANGAVNLITYGYNNADSHADGNAIGLFGGGTTHANANGDGTTVAAIDGVNSLTAGALNVLATGSTNVVANSSAGSLGFIAARDSRATANSTPTVDAHVSSVDNLRRANAITVSDTVNITGRAYGSSSATASGNGVGVGTFGISQSVADWNPNVNAYIGAGTLLGGTANVNVMALNNYDAFGNAPTGNSVYSHATSSGAGLVSAGGARSDANVHASVVANVGDYARVSGNNISVTAKSSNFANSSVDGKSYGGGAFGNVTAGAYIWNQALANTGNDVGLNAGNDIRLYSESNNRGSVNATGGVGGLLGDGGATANLIVASNHTISQVGAHNFVNAGNEVNLGALNNDDLRSTAYSEALGAIAINEASALTQDNDSHTEVRVAAGAKLNARTVTMRAEDGNVYHSANGVAKTDLQVVGSATATGEVDANVNALAFIGANAHVSATGVTTVTAYQTAVKTYSRAETYVAGVQGALHSNSINNRNACADVVAEGGALVTTAQLNVLAYSERDLPDLYVRDAITTANTVTELVSEIVGYACEVIVDILCLGFCDSHSVCSPVTKLVEHILASPVDQNYGGNNATCNDINWNADVTISASSTPTLIVDAYGNVVTASGVTYQNLPDAIVVDNIVNDSPGHIQMTAALGDVSGNSVFRMNVAFDAVNITNASTKRLDIHNIDVLNTSSTTPPIHITAANENFNYTVITNGSSTDITIQNTNPDSGANINLLGYIANRFGETHILNSGGSIVSGGAADYIQTRILQLRADQGSVGSANTPIVAFLFSDLSAGEAHVKDATGLGGVYLDLTAMTISGDASASVDNASAAQGNVDIIFRNGLSRDETTTLQVTLKDGTILTGLIENEVLGTGFDLVNGSTVVHVNSADIASTNLLTALFDSPVHAAYQLGNISAGGDIVVQSAAADLEVDGVMSAGGLNSIVTDSANITGGNSTHVVGGNSIYLSAGAGIIGTSTQALRTAVGNGQIDATALGDVFLQEVSGDLRVGTIVSNSGNVNLVALAASIVDADQGSAPDVIGRFITLQAAGGIGAPDAALEILSQAQNGSYDGAGGTLTSSSKLDTYVTQTGGDLLLNTVSTDALHSAFITAATGSLINANPGGINVLAGNAKLVAANDIGQSGNRIKTRVNAIEAQSTSGSTWIDNTGALAIGGSFTSDEMAIFARGTVTVNATGPIEVKKNILSGESLLLIALDTAGDDSAMAEVYPDNLLVDGVNLASNDSLSIKAAGSVRLLAGDDLTVQTGVLVEAGSSIEIKGNFLGDSFGNIDVFDAGATAQPVLPSEESGSTIAIAGTLIAPTILIHGDSGADVINITGTLLAAYPWASAVTDTGLFFRLPPTLDTASQITIRGEGGDDRINVWGTVVARETDIYGDTGNDIIALNPVNDNGYSLAIAGQVNVWGGDGQDQLIVNQLNTLDPSHKFVPNMTGPTSIVTGLETQHLRNTVNLDGQGGSDAYLINLTGNSDYLINVHDSGVRDQSFDLLAINGTSGDDTLLLRANFVSLLQTDPSTGQFAQTYERINYDSTIDLLNVNGLAGNDHFYVDDNSAVTVLTGGAGDNTFQFGQMFGADRTSPNSVQFGDEVTTEQTTAGFLSSGISYATAAYGSTGNDVFTVYSNKAQLYLNGNGGNDKFIVRAFNLLNSDANLSSGAAIPSYSINAPVFIDGGVGVNSLTVLGTEANDTFVVTQNEVLGAGLNVNFVNIQKLEVNGLGGNDIFDVLSTGSSFVTTLIGGGGNDTFNIAGDVTTPVIAQSVAESGIYLNAGQPLQTFGPQLHQTSAIQGPLIIEGDTILNRDLSLSVAVMLPSETDSPLSVVGTDNNFAAQTDTVNVFNDGSASNDTGHLGYAVNSTGLASNFGVQPGTVDLTSFGNISGDNLGISLSIDGGKSQSPSVATFDGGVTYNGVEVVDVMLGVGNDTFTVDNTTAGSITVVQGGGGNNHLIANGGGGPEAPLILFGSTSQDGSFYNSTDTNITGMAREFSNPGNNVLDARNDTHSVVLYGGPGSDTIYGGGAGDWIAGGSGNNIIFGGAGNDIILGNDGFNLDLSTRLSLSTQVLLLANTPSPSDDATTHDALVAGSDTIYGGNGNDIIIGDHGIVAQVDGTNRILTTGQVIAVQSVRPEDGASDTIHAGNGRNLVIGGSGNDAITAGRGDNIIIGDNGSVTFSSPGVLASVQTSDPTYGGNDSIAVECGNNFILGGVGNDTIRAEGGNNVVIGDDGMLSFLAGPVRVSEDWQTYGYGPVLERYEHLTYAGGLLVRAETLDSSVGGHDIVTVGNGRNLLIGGAGNDTIKADHGDNIILGDNGAVVFTQMGLLSSIQTSDPAHGGNDRITVECGNNIILGGSGSDIIFAGSGDNIIIGDNGALNFAVPKHSTCAYGRSEGRSDDRGSVLLLVTSADPAYGGNDQITAGNGENIVIGGTGNDTLKAGRGDNIIIGDNGSINFREGGSISSIQTSAPDYTGNDHIAVECGDNIILGGSGSDTIVADHGDNIIIGDNGSVGFTEQGLLAVIQSLDPASGGDDQITAGNGENIIIGGSGNDTLKAGRGDNIILGDNGSINFRECGSISSIQTSNPGFGGNDRITVECGDNILLGGSGSDAIVTDSGDNIIIGDNGSVSFRDEGLLSLIQTSDPTYGGNDRITVGCGDNIILGGSGSDTIVADKGENIIFGDNGSVSFNEHGLLAVIQSVDPANGGDDLITVGCGDNVIIGGAGADTIKAGEGTNVIFGDDGQITFGRRIDSSGHPSASKTLSECVIVTAKTIDPEIGGADKITFGSGHNVIFGGPGNDVIKTGRGGNIVFGGNGQVTFDEAHAKFALQTTDSSRAGVDQIVAGGLDVTMPKFDWSGFLGSASDSHKAVQADAGSAWLDDFLNHIGQSATQRNPNANIRVRVDAVA
jgi:hypothetical protein